MTFMHELKRKCLLSSVYCKSLHLMALLNLLEFRWLSEVQVHDWHYSKFQLF